MNPFVGRGPESAQRLARKTIFLSPVNNEEITAYPCRSALGRRWSRPGYLMNTDLWQHCLNRLGNEIPNQQFNTWIRPLHAEETPESLRLLAPNQFVLDWVRKHHFETISRTLHDIGPDLNTDVQLDIGSSSKRPVSGLQIPAENTAPSTAARAARTGASWTTPPPPPATTPPTRARS